MGQAHRGGKSAERLVYCDSKSVTYNRLIESYGNGLKSVLRRNKGF